MKVLLDPGQVVRGQACDAAEMDRGRRDGGPPSAAASGKPDGLLPHGGQELEFLMARGAGRRGEDEQFLCRVRVHQPLCVHRELAEFGVQVALEVVVVSDVYLCVVARPRRIPGFQQGRDDLGLPALGIGTDGKDLVVFRAVFAQRPAMNREPVPRVTGGAIQHGPSKRVSVRRASVVRTCTSELPRSRPSTPIMAEGRGTEALHTVALVVRTPSSSISLPTDPLHRWRGPSDEGRGRGGLARPAGWGRSSVPRTRSARRCRRG
jgi:hypothetical protein